MSGDRSGSVHGSASERPSAFILRGAGDDDFIKHLEGGVYRGTSISFALKTPECSICSEDLRGCSHYPGQEYEGQICYYLLKDV